MGLNGSGPFFQRSMAIKVLAGYVTRICDIYIDDVLLFGATDDEYLETTVAGKSPLEKYCAVRVLVRLCGGKVTANPEKTELGLD